MTAYEIGRLVKRAEEEPSYGRAALAGAGIGASTPILEYLIRAAIAVARKQSPFSSKAIGKMITAKPELYPYFAAGGAAAGTGLEALRPGTFAKPEDAWV